MSEQVKQEGNFKLKTKKPSVKKLAKPNDIIKVDLTFKSKAQMQACYAQNNPKWDCQKWSKETENKKSLPKRLLKKT